MPGPSSSQYGNTPLLRNEIPDSEEEDSDDEFTHFEEILRVRADPRTDSHAGSKRMDPSTTRSREPVTRQQRSKAQLNLRGGGTKHSLGSGRVSAPSASSGQPGFSMADLLARAEKIEKRNVEIARAEKLQNESAPTDDNPSTSKSKDAGSGLNPNGGGEEGGGLGLEEAVQRLSKDKDSWGKKTSWIFFSPTGQAKPSHKLFPTASLAAIGIPPEALEDPQSRAELFVSGFVADTVALAGRFPTDLGLWLIDEICLEKREDVSLAYFSVLKRFVIANNFIEISPERINSFFVLLGAHENALNVKSPLTRQPDKLEGNKVVDFTEKLWNLSLFLRFLCSMPSSFSDESYCQTFCLILRLSFDYNLTEHGGASALIDDVLIDLVRGIPDVTWNRRANMISSTIASTFQDSSGQFEILKAIPISVARLHWFRRQLALVFFFDKPDYFNKQVDAASLLSGFIRKLRSSDFSVTPDTDYSALFYSINILDLALDNLGGTAPDDSRQLANVDQAVEAMCNKLRELDDKVLDGAIMSLWRTEVKDSISRIEGRLRHVFLTKRSRLKQSLLNDHFKVGILG